MGNDHITIAADEKKRTWLMIALSALAGVVVFIGIYGVRVLDVTNVRWLIDFGNNGDLANHYIGWLYYRKTPWQFPVGLVEGMVYPSKVSVIYLDAIPLFALFFKALSPILPGTFQYFGIYGLVTYMFQSVLGSLLVYSKTRNRVVSLISSVIFALSSVLAWRMFAHSALSFHPVILASMLVYFNKDRIGSGKKSVILWMLLYLVACSIHAYLVPMVLAFHCAYYLKELFSKKWYKAIAEMAVCAVVLLGAMYTWGYFYGVSDYGDVGFGQVNADLNALINDIGSSFFMKEFGKATSNAVSFEGYSYIGFGMILLGIIDAVVVLVDRRPLLKKIRIPTVILLFVFFFAATFPIFRLGGQVLFELPLPEKVMQLGRIFRANSRFMWPVLYLLMFGIIVCTYKLFGKKAPALLIVAAVLQLIDLSPLYRMRYTALESYSVAPDVLSSPVWDELDKDEVYFLYLPEYSVKQCKALEYYACMNDMVMRDGFVSRKNNEMILADRQNEIDNILRGDPDPDKLYILNDAENQFFYAVPLQYLLYDTNLNIYKVDDAYIGVTEELDGVEEISLENGIDLLKYVPPSITSMTGADIAGHIHTDGSGVHLHGNEVAEQTLMLPDGTYQITLTGDDFDNLDYGLISTTDPDAVVQILRDEEELIQMKVELSSSMSALKLQCKNIGTGEVLLTSVMFTGSSSEYIPGEIDFGTKVNFTNAFYSAGQYIKSGMYGAEAYWSWTEGEESEFYFTLPENSGMVKGNIELYTIFGSSQSVEIYVNDQLVSSQTITAGGTLTFDFMCPEDGAFALKIVHPDAISPADLGQSADIRPLSLAISSIYFEQGQ